MLSLPSSALTAADIAREREQRNRHRDRIKAVIDTAEHENRGITVAEQRDIDTLADEVRQIDERAADFDRRTRPTAIPVLHTTGVGYTATRAGIYTPESSCSYFLDSFRATRGDFDAADRLRRHASEFRDIAAARPEREVRALSTTLGAAGDFTPPAWLLDEWIAAVRPARATADAMTNEPLPDGASQLNVPKITTGTTTAIQGTQNTPISQTDLATATVNAPVYTVAGGDTLSQQLIDQSPIRGSLDRIVLTDLLADYNRAVGNLVLNGSGSGQPLGLLTAATNAISYTAGTPAFAGSGNLLGKIAAAIATIQTNRYAGPTAIVMHPRRWNWIAVQTDTQNRPMIVPTANGPTNSAGVITVTGAAQGTVGQILGIPVIADPNIPTNQGTGTNQDVILVGRLTDSYLYESNPRLDTFQQTYAQNLSVFVRLYNYIAVANRLTQSLVQITGTGLAAPTF